MSVLPSGLARAPGAAAARSRPAPGTRPLPVARAATGFPSPADDHLDRPLDIAEHLVRHPEATFFLRARGRSMIGAGIHDGDLLVVDRAVDPVHGKVVIGEVNGKLIVRRLCLRGGRMLLLPENPEYAPLDVAGRDDVRIWGVVTYVVHAP